MSTSEIGQLIQEEIYQQVTDGRLNNIRIRNQIDPLYKNFLRSQYSNKILFSNKSKTDRNNPILRDLFIEADKKTVQRI